MEQQIQVNKKLMTVQTGLFIHNQFVPSVSKKTFPTVDPSNGKIICHVSEGDSQDIELAIISAQKGLQEWSKLSPIQRGDILYKIHERILQHQEELAQIEALDQGKPVSIAKKYDVAALAFTFKYYAGWTDKFYSKFIPGQNNEISYTKHEPYGITAGIIPWNYPLMFIGWKLAPALACGNVHILKPSEKTPLSALYFANIIKDLLPPGVFNVINGYGPTCGSPLALHMKVKKIAFTGSTPVGKKILEMSSKSNLKKVALELGGKSPNIIFNDADLKAAVPAAGVGVFANAGQVCCACSRIYVQEGIYDEFLKKLVQFGQKLPLGDQWQNSPFYLGPVVDKLQYDRIRKYINLGIQEGATLIGEVPPENQQGYFIKPIIFTNCTEDMTIVKEEIFGPVAVIIKFKTTKEVIEKANNSQYGLGAAVFSNDINTCLQVSNSIEAGTVWVNNILLDVYCAQLPFGGYKESGFGREGADYCLQEWSQVKTVKIKIKPNL